MQKLTLKWLQRHMDFFEKDVIQNIENIDEVLNKKGIEIEDIKLINPFIVVKINEVSREDGLKVCINPSLDPRGRDLLIAYNILLLETI